ncbi:MAG: NRDE family protein [Cytophagales bacterium]|nr:NRDE family protein [Rhizobacter sp.]
MCLAALTIGQSERFRVVLASNRDKFFARASQPLAW